MLLSCCFDDYRIVGQFEVREPNASSSIFFFLKVVLAVWGLCVFLTSCKVFYSGENVIGSLIEIALNLYCFS